MSGAEANTLWARALADELARAGVREVVAAPGSRSTPLVLAFARDERLRVRVHPDERSAAFFALGVGKASGAPAVVVTTSGTAAANALPAVVEAALSEAPLIVTTADRPPRLRDADANQTVDQHRLYGSYPRAFFEPGPPSTDPRALGHLRTVAQRAVAAASGRPAGPVHLNCPFDKPLEPVDGAGAALEEEHPLAVRGRPEGAPFVRIAQATPALPDGRTLAELAELVAGTERGVVVAGPSPAPGRVGPAAARLAAAAGYPLLADPLSGARFGPGNGALIVDGYDLFFGDETVDEALKPSLVLRVGRSPTSARLQGYLARHSGVRHVVVDDGGRWLDHQAVVTDYVRADPEATLLALAEGEQGREGSGWLDLWRRASEAAREVAADTSGEAHEGLVLAGVAAAAPAGADLFVSSSMPVRDLDGFGTAREAPLRVLGNRGASGIDGIVSTACGVSAASGAPTVCVLGDLAFLHDQNGLLWSREDDVAVVFVLVDNDGGGIFHMLPVREHEPYFTPYFATPHGLDLSRAAELFSVPWEEVETASVGEALERALAAGGSRILRIRSDREANRRRHAEVVSAVRDAVRRAVSP